MRYTIAHHPSTGLYSIAVLFQVVMPVELREEVFRPVPLPYCRFPVKEHTHHTLIMHRIYANAANSRLLLPIHFNTLQRALDQNGPIIDGSIPLMLSVGVLLRTTFLFLPASTTMWR